MRPAIQQLIDDMFETMHEYQGIGLAAPQVHEGIRLFVAGVDDPDAGVPPVVMVNPADRAVGPDHRRRLGRAVSASPTSGARCRVTSTSASGPSTVTDSRSPMTASGFAARVIQHETDHLDGVCISRPDDDSLQSLTFLAEYDRYWTETEDHGRGRANGARSYRTGG